MPFLEDLILGIEGPDYSLVGADLSPEERRKKREEEFLAYQTQLRDMWSAPAGGQAGLEAASAEAAGLGGQPRELIRDVAQARIGEREAAEGEDVIRAAVEAQRSKAAEQDDWVRSVGYEPDPMLSDPDKGILVEEIPADKLLRIRKQAAQRKPGYTGGTGSFSTQEMTPEIAARGADTASWLSGQTERDLAFAVSPDQARRDPEYAAGASGDLAQLRQQRQFTERQTSVDAIVAKMGGNSGKIPFEDAQKLQMLGVNIPYGSVGLSRDDGIAFFDSAIAEAGKALSSVDQLQAIGNPNIAEEMKFNRHGAMLAEEYKRKIAAGMNPEDAKREWIQEMSQLALANGLINEQQIAATQQQLQQPAGN